MTSKIDMPVTPCEVEEMLPKTKYMTAAEFEERVCDKLNKISKDYDDQAQRIMAAIKRAWTRASKSYIKCMTEQ